MNLSAALIRSTNLLLKKLICYWSTISLSQLLFNQTLYAIQRKRNVNWLINRKK